MPWSRYLILMLVVAALGPFVAVSQCHQPVGVVYLTPDADGTKSLVVLEQCDSALGDCPAFEQDPSWVEAPDQDVRQGDCIFGASDVISLVRQCRDAVDETGAEVRLCSLQTERCCTLPCCDPMVDVCDDPLAVCLESELLECPQMKRCRAPAEICERIFLWPQLLVPEAIVESADVGVNDAVLNDVMVNDEVVP